MKKLLIISVLLIFSANSNAGWFSSDKDEVLEKLDRISNEINATLLPKMVDKHTRFDTTYVLDGFFVGQHTVSDEVIAVGKHNIQKRLKEMTINQYCTSPSPEHKFFRKNNIGMKRTYYSQSGVYFLGVTATMKDCR